MKILLKFHYDKYQDNLDTFDMIIIFLIFQGDIITVANGKSAMIDLDVAYLNNGRNSSGKLDSNY